MRRNIVHARPSISGHRGCNLTYPDEYCIAAVAQNKIKL